MEKISIFLIIDFIGYFVTLAKIKSLGNVNWYRNFPFHWLYYVIMMNAKKNKILRRNKQYALNFYEWREHWVNDVELNEMVRFQISMYCRANNRINRL